MGKKSRTALGPARGAVLDRPSAAAADSGEVPVVGPREPCPCGSGRRYKLCHGRAARAQDHRLVTRPFAGLDGECDLVAMREIVPAASAPVTTLDGRDVLLVTLLPMAWPALHRADGTVLVALQTGGSSGDASRDIAAALQRALDTAPGNPVPENGRPGAGPRLQDLLAPGPLTVTVHDGFDYWFDDAAELVDEAKSSLEQANASVVPTQRLAAAEAAYWVEVGGRRHLRWVLPDDEAAVLDGLARLHAAGSSGLVPGSRYVGSFRAHGLVVPVWDLPAGTSADDLEEPMSAFPTALREAMARTEPLTEAERRAKAGVVNRQLTLR